MAERGEAHLVGDIGDGELRVKEEGMGDMKANSADKNGRRHSGQRFYLPEYLAAAHAQSPAEPTHVKRVGDIVLDQAVCFFQKGVFDSKAWIGFFRSNTFPGFQGVDGGAAIPHP